MLLYSWRFFSYSVPIQWLVHGHMTSNNEAVYRQMPLTSQRETVHCFLEMLTAVARDQIMQFKIV